MSFIDQLRAFLTKKRNLSTGNPLADMAISKMVKPVNTITEKVSVPIANQFVKVANLPSAAVMGMIDETTKPIKSVSDILSVPLRPTTGLFKGAKEGLTNPDYSVYEGIQKAGGKLGITPALTIPAGLIAEVAMPGPGEIGAASKLSKVGKLSDIEKLSDATKVADTAKLTSKLDEIEEAIRVAPDIKTKSILAGERSKVMDILDPSRVAKQKEFDVFEATNTAKNQALAESKAKLKPLEDELALLKPKLIAAGQKAKGSVKGSPEWTNMHNLKLEEQRLLSEQENILKGRTDTGTKTVGDIIKAKDVPAVSTPKTEVPIMEAPKVEPTKVSDFDVEIESSFKPALQKVKDTIAQKNLDPVEVLENRHLGDDVDVDVKSAWDDLNKVVKGMYEKYTGKSIKELENYVPDPTPGSAEEIVRRITGGNFLDDVTKFYDPSAHRTTPKGLAHKTGDIDYVYDSYVESIRYQANRLDIEAARNGITRESQQILDDTAKNIGEQIAKDGVSNVDLVKATRDIAEIEGKVLDDIPVGKATWLQRNAKDHIQAFQELGIYDHFYKVINYHQEARILAQRILPFLEKGDTLSVVNGIRTRFPDIDLNDTYQYLNWVERKGGDVDAAVAVLIDKLSKREAMNTVTEMLPRLNFADGTTKDYVNSVLNYTLSEGAKTKNVLVKAETMLRKLTTAGMIGLNVSSSILNLVEARRLLGVGNPKYFITGFMDAVKQGFFKGSDAVKKYGFDDDMAYKEIFANSPLGKGIVQNLSGKANHVLDAVMVPFMKTEKFKNRWFLNAFEREAMEKGITGEALNKYVIDKFRKYALYGDKWGTVGGLKNEHWKTIFQFSQYAVRDLGILQSKMLGLSKGEAGALQYVLAYGFTGALVYGMYEKMGLNGLQAAVSLPAGLDKVEEDESVIDFIRSVSPNTMLGVDTIAFIKDYMDGDNNDEDTGLPTGDRVEAYIEQRLQKDLLRRIPGGSQGLKTIGYAQDLARGYNENTKGNVRYPVNPTSVTDILGGATFGSSTTKAGNDFWDKYKKDPYVALDKNDSETFRTLQSGAGREAAASFWQGTTDDKVSEKTTTADLLSGKMVKKAGDVQDQTGRTDILPTTQQILANDVAEDQAYSRIQSLEGKLQKQVQSGAITQEQATQALDSLIGSEGWTMDKYRTRQYGSSDLKAEQKAQIMVNFINEGKFNIAELYKNGLLTLESAKELERMEKIDSADDLWEKAKLTDPYYFNKELRSMREKYSKQMAEQVQDNIATSIKSRKNVSSLLSGAYKKNRSMLSRKSKITKPKTIVMPNPKAIKVNKAKKPTTESMYGANIRPSSNLFNSLKGYK